MPLSDTEIEQLWSDESFSGGFESAYLFQKALQYEKNEKVSLKRIYKILSRIEEFQNVIRPVKHFKRRSYKNVHGYFVLVQIDIGLMPKYRNKIGFLSLIDIFSRKIFARSLKRKTPAEVVKALKSIFKEANSIPQTVNADRGKEFLGKKCQSFFKQNGIHFWAKIGKLKASEAERSIHRIKKVLYNQMRFQKTRNWVKILPSAISRINNIPRQILNGYKPADFKGIENDNLIPLPKEVFWKDLIENQKKYEANKLYLQKGDKVKLDNYIFAKHTNFPKSYDLQVKMRF